MCINSQLFTVVYVNQIKMTVDSVSVKFNHILFEANVNCASPTHNKLPSIRTRSGVYLCSEHYLWYNCAHAYTHTNNKRINCVICRPELILIHCTHTVYYVCGRTDQQLERNLCITVASARPISQYWCARSNKNICWGRSTSTEKPQIRHDARCGTQEPRLYAWVM